MATNTNDGTLTPGATPFVINNLAPDTYNIVITDETTGCVSQNYQVTIGQDGVEPDINVTKTNDNFCTGGNATITLDAVAPPDGDEADFNFDWYNGTNSSGATFQDGAGVNSATNLAAGDYTIVITALGTADDGIDCETTVQVNITDDPYSLAVNATGTDLDDCTPDDGIITINSLDLTSVEDGTSNPAINDADVTYEIFSDAALTTSVASTTGDAATSFTGLAPGTYYLTATYNGTSAIAPGCASPAVQIILDDNSNSPTITITESAQNTVCDPASSNVNGGNANGRLTLEVTAGDLDGNYDVQWYVVVWVTPLPLSLMESPLSTTLQYPLLLPLLWTAHSSLSSPTCRKVLTGLRSMTT